MINFHLTIWRRKQSFYLRNPEENKLQGYAIYVDTLLIKTVYGFFVATNLKITHSLELEGIILQTKEKNPYNWDGQQKGVRNTR